MLCAWTGASASNASPPVDLSESDSISLDSGQLRFYRDKTNTLTLEQIQSDAVQKNFLQLEQNISFGYVPDSFWLSFTIDKQEAQASLWWIEVLPPYLDDIQLFHIDPVGNIATSRGGDFIPFSQKQEAYRGTLFKLDLQAGHHEFYLRLKSSSAMTAVVKLWQPEAFSNQARVSYFVFGLYFSLILAVFLFTLINWLVLKRSIFFYYSFYLLLNAIQWLAINGFVGEFVFPEQPLYSNLTLGIGLTLATAMAYVFYSKLYELKYYHPWIYILYVVAAVVALATAVAVPFGMYQSFAPVMLIMAMLAILSSPWPLLRLWRSKEVWQRLIVAAYGVFSILVSINILASLSIIEFTETTLYMGMISNLFHILLLHFALMFQYRDKAEAARRAILETKTAQLETEREKAQGQQQNHFLAMVAHEIRTPIAVIDGANESLRMLTAVDEHDIEQKQRRFNRISSSVKRLNGVLEMALINTEHESWPFELTAVNMDDLSRDTLESFVGQGLKRLTLVAQEQSLTVSADRRMLRIAMLNIIDNALKYSPALSLVTINIYRSVFQDRNGVSWLVSNRGANIPDAIMNTIFNKYQRGNNSSDQTGLGLGLYLVKNVIERHQGHVIVENLPEGGTQFGFWLPIDYLTGVTKSADDISMTKENDNAS